MSIRRLRFVSAVASVVVAFGVMGAPAAMAASAQGTVVQNSALGITYRSSNTINTGPIFARSTIVTLSGSQAPTGYMGALARSYKNNALCASGSTTYNSAPATGQNNVTPGSGCGSGAYYSSGNTFIYNGNGYNAVTPPRSPSLNG